MLALCPLDMSMDFNLAAWEAAPCPFKHVLFVDGLAGGVGPFYNAMLKVFGRHVEFHYAVRNEAVIANGRIVGFQDLPLSVEDALMDGLEGLMVNSTARYRALKEVCQACPSKLKCCPNADARKITREEHEDARQVARDIAKTRQYDISMRLRKKVESIRPV